MPRVYKRPDTRRPQADAIFVVLNLLGDANPHHSFRSDNDVWRGAIDKRSAIVPPQDCRAETAVLVERGACQPTCCDATDAAFADGSRQNFIT